MDPNKKDKSVVEFDDGTAKKYTIVPDNAVKQLEESMAKAQEKTGKTMKMTVVAKSLTIAQAKDEVAKRNGGDKGTKPGTGANARVRGRGSDRSGRRRDLKLDRRLVEARAEKG